MNKFKFHMQEKINDTIIKIENINQKILKLTPNSMNLEEYGPKKVLKQQYLAEKQCSLIKTLLGPTEEELKKFIIEKELIRLNQEKKALEDSVEELKKAILAIEDNQMVSTIDKSNNVIKELLAHSININLTPQETTKLLLTIIRNTNKNNHVVSSIKSAIEEFYDEFDNIKDGININALKLVYDKLFQVILTKEEHQRYSIVINSLSIQITLDKKEDLSKKAKDELLIQKENLEKIKTYIYNNSIINYPKSIEEFIEIVSLSGLEPHIAEDLINKMSAALEAENLKEEQRRIVSLLKEYLSDEEILHIKKSKELEQVYPSPIKETIIRLRTDVISMCKYVDMVKNTPEMHDSLDALSKRQSLLSHLVVNLPTTNELLSTFKYLPNEEQIPFILRTIESTDDTELPSIYYLLLKLADTKKATRLISHQESIYVIKNEQHSLLYSKKNDEIIIIDILFNRNLPKKITIPSIYIKQLKELEHQKNNPNYNRINAIYEELVTNALSPNISEVKLSLRK